MTSKRELRALVRQLKSEYSAEQLSLKSDSVLTAVLQHPRYQAAQTVLLYASLPDEVNTDQLVSHALRSGKTVLLPTVVGNDLELHLLSAHESLHTGSFNIRESDGTLFSDWERIDLVIVPGLAFDKQGHRLGRGRGFYDRLLCQLHAYKLGIAFDFQQFESIPVDPLDQTLDEVIFSHEEVFRDTP